MTSDKKPTEVRAAIERLKEMSEKLDAAINGGPDISLEDRTRAVADVQLIIDSLRNEPVFQEKFGESFAHLESQMNAIRQKHTLEEKDTPNAHAHRPH